VSGHVTALRPEFAEQAFDLASEVFVSSSSLHRALGIELDAYRTYLRPSFMAMLRENLSVMFLEDDRLVGCLIATELYDVAGVQVSDDPIFAPIGALSAALCAEFLGSVTLTTGETVLIDMAVVAPRAEGRGVYQEMRHEAHRIAKAAGFQSVVGELSSPATQHVVLTQFGHKVVASQTCADFMYEGRKPFASITTPAEILLAQGAL